MAGKHTGLDERADGRRDGLAGRPGMRSNHHYQRGWREVDAARAKRDEAAPGEDRGPLESPSS